MRNKFPQTPEVIQRFQANGLETGNSTPQEGGDVIRADS